MKKRIGSKLYDTETSELIADVGVGILYRKRTRKREWFLVIGDHVESVDDKQAKALLGNPEMYPKKPDLDSVMIRVDRATHNKIASRAAQENLSITKFMKKWAETL